MDETPIPPVESPASSTSVQKNTLWKFILGGVFLALLFLGAGLFWVYMAGQTQKDALIPQIVQEPLGWRAYENSEIGIAFEYPAVWGDISVSKEVADCYSTDTTYYSASKLVQMRKDVAESPNDSCQQVRLMVGGAIIVQTATPLANKYPVPRGGYWGDMSSSVTSDAYITNFCTKHTVGTCNLISNMQKIPIVRYEGIIGMGDEVGEVYLVHTAHPLYYGLALSPSRLPVKDDSDFMRLIETLRFIPSN